MSPDRGDNTIQFRAGAEKEAADALDTVRLGGINRSELARAGFVKTLRRTLSDTEKISIYERYDRGDLSEEAAHVLFGDKIDQIQEDTEAFARATEVDPDQFFVD
jgi:hypothetical protein